ncbi:MAG: hypothetical protein AB1757_09940 [Acidobacteriota bacterium]
MNSITINLPADIEKEMAEEVAKIGLSLSEFIVQKLQARRIAKPSVKTDAALVNYWRLEGLIGTRSDITDSQKQARTIREEVEKRLRS